ncbi:MAG: basic amino acid ABC transporter substrate-binding protein [Mesoaciditoga sp.]|uniref:basic amino acid ABC transporter substrate-binding protein n=1 Tax=Athalassotoga sp. TaxID=2022597 RepID=UPI000CADB8A1|nr:MAG: basic amino acid ABC transporter substrate-binding protein [Mesoaciditoga sp.]HEU25094.1 basic amino acid ABC transporter substrate-binding protein [Mesoaciditoga lauensis]
MKRIFVILVILLIFGSFALSKTYIIGTSADFPPFEYVDNGKYVGFDMDLIRSIANLEGFQVEIRDMSFDSLIPALKSGIIDIAIAGMTITPERLKVVDFSTPYWSADQDVIVKKNSNYNLTVLFGNHKVGVQTGTTGDLWVSDNLIKTNILKSIVRYESFIYALQALLNGEIDAVVLDSPVAERFAQTQPVSIVGIIITNENYGIAVNKGNSELLSKINDGLSKMRSSGQLTSLVDKYFGK